jgi:hypothetical protein
MVSQHRVFQWPIHCGQGYGSRLVGTALVPQDWRNRWDRVCAWIGVHEQMLWSVPVVVFHCWTLHLVIFHDVIVMCYGIFDSLYYDLMMMCACDVYFCNLQCWPCILMDRLHDKAVNIQSLRWSRSIVLLPLISSWCLITNHCWHHWLVPEIDVVCGASNLAAVEVTPVSTCRVQKCTARRQKKRHLP